MAELEAAIVSTMDPSVACPPDGLGQLQEWRALYEASRAPLRIARDLITTTFASATAPGRNAAITQLSNIFKDYRPSAHAPVRRIRAYNALQVLNSGLSVATQVSLLNMSSAQDSSATNARRALESQLVLMQTHDHELAPNTGQLPDKFQVLRMGGAAARAGLESEPEPFNMVTAVDASGDAEA